MVDDILASSQEKPNIKVFHEVGGGAFVKFDPKSPESLALGVAQALENPLREKLIQCGRENVKRFTWAETARKTQEIWHACTKP